MMVVGEVAEPVDLLVVGGGIGGYAAAVRGAQLGRRVTLVDADGEAGLGGVCLHRGCIPSKALIEAADAVAGATGRERMGVVGEKPRFDAGRFQAFKAELVRRMTLGVGALLQSHGVDVVEGRLRFSAPDRGAVQQPSGSMLYLSFKDVVIATGSRPAELPDLPFDGTRVIDSSDLLALDELPERVVVVGAGYVGLELGTALAKLGAVVTVVEATDRLLGGADDQIARAVRNRLGELGVTIHLSSRIERSTEDAVVVRSESGSVSVPADVVMVAVGRRPNTDDLGLEQLGIQPDARGLLPVGPDRLASPHVAAIGDLVDGPALAHKASHEAAVAVEALCGIDSAFDALVPVVAFTDPEVASVGLTESAARAAGLDVQAGAFPFSASGRAATLGARAGFARAIVDRGSDRVVGVQIVGPHASELIAEATLAVEYGASPLDLTLTVHPHPTLSESLSEVGALLADRPLHARAR